LRAGVFVRERAEAVVHLFRVASGLESLILGEAEILGQVRRALTAGAPGPVLDRLFAHALRTGRRVRAETELARGPGSVPAAAAALVEREPVGQVLILGAGKMAELVALNLRSRGERAIVIANRTVERGEQLARRVGGRAVSLDAVREELACADAVICATGSPDVVVTQRTVRTRGGRPLFLIDLALPRDVDPRVADVPGCRLVGLDDLRTVVDATSCARERGIVCAEAIVDEEAARFAAWHRARSAAAAIAALHRNADEIRSSILARHAAALTALGPEAGRLVDVLTAQLVAALLHAPTVALKGESGDVTGASPAHGPTLAA
jgi:glutamyl-tRNA reductase